MKATDILKEEHQVILRMLDCLAAIVKEADQTKKLDTESLRKSLEFFRGFADACHHGKEEAQLFPVLGINNASCSPGTQHILLAEHEEGREYVREIGENLEKYEKGDAAVIPRISMLATRFIEHLANHIHKEDGCLFPMADSRLSAAEQENLLKAFEKVEREEFGAGTHEKYLAIANDLCRKWKVEPVASAHSCCGH
ncbi:MAG: hemerythrin domain-containing protein [Deltaproteobacteria bacterium]|nr:hemerythrin domain-containing protein [Deltaproteobacteria bacterium]